MIFNSRIILNISQYRSSVSVAFKSLVLLPVRDVNFFFFVIYSHSFTAILRKNGTNVTHTSYVTWSKSCSESMLPPTWTWWKKGLIVSSIYFILFYFWSFISLYVSIFIYSRLLREKAGIQFSPPDHLMGKKKRELTRGRRDGDEMEKGRWAENKIVEGDIAERKVEDVC